LAGWLDKLYTQYTRSDWPGFWFVCSELVSSFLTAYQHILGYSVPFIHSVLFTVW